MNTLSQIELCVPCKANMVISNIELAANLLNIQSIAFVKE